MKCTDCNKIITEHEEGMCPACYQEWLSREKEWVRRYKEIDAEFAETIRSENESENS